MKILVLADVHANWQALSAIQERFDYCLFAGDLVEYGTDPRPCIDWIRRNAAAAVRGNHDHASAQQVPARNGKGFRRLTAATRSLHRQMLPAADMRWLARLPVTQYVTLGGYRFFLVHATPRDPLDEYLTDSPAEWRVRLESVDADFVCVGHTHIPMHLDLGEVQLVNPGSVGQPRDGDPRAAYAVIENGQVSLRRVSYNIDAAVQQMRESGIDLEAAAVAEQVLRSGGRFCDR